MTTLAPEPPLLDQPYFVPARADSGPSVSWLLVTPPKWFLPDSIRALATSTTGQERHVAGWSKTQEGQIYSISGTEAEAVIDYLVEQRLRRADSIDTGNFSVDEVMTLNNPEGIPYLSVLDTIGTYRRGRNFSHDWYQTELERARRRTRSAISERLAELTSDQINALSNRHLRALREANLGRDASVSALELGLRGIYDSVTAINEDLRLIEHPDAIDAALAAMDSSDVIDVSKLLDPALIGQHRFFTHQLRDFIRYNYLRLPLAERKRWGLVTSKPPSKARLAQLKQLAAEHDRQRQQEQETRRKEKEQRQDEKHHEELWKPLLEAWSSSPPEGRSPPTVYRVNINNEVVEQLQVTVVYDKPKSTFPYQYLDVIVPRYHNLPYSGQYERVPGSLMYRKVFTDWKLDLRPQVYLLLRKRFELTLPGLRTDLVEVLGKDMAGYVLSVW